MFRGDFGFGNWQLAWRSRFIDDFERDPGDVVLSNNGPTTACAVLGGPTNAPGVNGPCVRKHFGDSVWYHDWSLSYDRDEWSATLGVRNLFDEEPPLIVRCISLSRILKPPMPDSFMSTVWFRLRSARTCCVSPAICRQTCPFSRVICCNAVRIRRRFATVLYDRLLCGSRTRNRAADENSPEPHFPLCKDYRQMHFFQGGAMPARVQVSSGALPVWHIYCLLP